MTVPQKQPEPEPPAVPVTFMDMLSRAIMSGAAPEIIDRLLDARDRWERGEARKAYDAALANARAKFKPIIKTNTVNLGGGRGYKYEGQDDIERAIIDALSAEGMTYGYSSQIDEDRKWIIVTCRLKHRDGHFEESSLPGPIDTSMAKNPIQAIGSTTTYLARYTLRLALGLAPTEDDDGRAAAIKTPPAPAPNPMPAAPNAALHDPETGEIKETAAPEAKSAQPGAADAAPPVQAPPEGMTAGGAALLSIEDLAREAAKQGDETFKAFYKHRDNAEKLRINKIGDELRGLIDAADKRK